LKIGEHVPSFVIIGAQKCGTTSLHYYLNNHPQIDMSREKELDFFIGTKNWHRGVEWYKSHFRAHKNIQGESSPNYTAYPRYQGVAQRMFSTIPKAKLIYILRDPVDRIISHYIHHFSEGREKKGFKEALQPLDQTNSYIFRSKYYMQLRQYLEFYSDTNILILTAEELYHRRRKTLIKVFRFLGVDDTYYTHKFGKLKHRSSTKGKKTSIGLFLKNLDKTKMAKFFSTDTRMAIGRIVSLFFAQNFERPALAEPLRNQIILCLKEDIDSLRKHTKMPFDEWCV